MAGFVKMLKAGTTVSDGTQWGLHRRQLTALLMTVAFLNATP